MADISRRKALGLLAAVSLPPTAVVGASAAAPIKEATPLDQMIADHAKLKAEATLLDAGISTRWNDPRRPPEAWVDRKEFAPALYQVPAVSHIRHSIVGYFEARRKEMANMYDVVTTAPIDAVYVDLASRASYEASFQKRVAELDHHQARVLALFDERQATFDAWAISSGFAAADDARFAVWDRAIETETQILRFKCVDMADFRAKAAFIVGEFGDSYTADEANRFIAELAS